MTVRELKEVLAGANDDADVNIRIPMKKGLHILKDISDVRAAAIEFMCIINIDPLSAVDRDRIQKEVENAS